MAWSRLFSHGIHGIHRSFVASVLPRNSQNSQKFGGAVGCVGMAGCHTLLHLCKSVLSVEATSLPEGSVHSVGSVGIQSPTDFTDLHRWLGCVCSSTEFTEFTEVLGCCWLRGYGRMPYPPNLCASVRICGRCFSARNFCAFRGFCGNIVSHGFHRSTQMVGCVNSPTEFTEFTEVLGCCWQRGYGRIPYPPNLCASVPICGRHFSARRFCVFCAFCGNIVSHGFHRSTQMVGCVNSPTEFTDQHRWLVALIRPRNSQKFGGAVGCVGTAGCHTLLICAHLCASVEATSLPEGSVCSVRSVGGVSQPEECVLWEVLLNQKSESSVGDYNFSMRKRLTMPKTRA